jgi:hypothetical protein
MRVTRTHDKVHTDYYDVNGKPLNEPLNMPDLDIMNDLGADRWELVSERSERVAKDSGTGIVNTIDVRVTRTFKRRVH